MTCEQATILLSRAMEEPLTRSERLRLWFHTAMCSACRNFGKNVQSLRDIGREFGQRDE